MDKDMSRARIISVIGCLAFLVMSHSAKAQDAEPAPWPVPSTEPSLSAVQLPSQFDDDWHFSLGIPFWMAGVSGDVATPNFSDIPVNASFTQIMSHFTFGAMAHGEARKGRYGLGLDLLYLNVGDTLDTGRALPALQTFNLGLKVVFAEGFSFYRLLQDGDARNPYTFDLLGGARYYWVESQFNNFSLNYYWVDLMLGIRGQIPFGEHLSIRGRSDYAFLGSKFTWDLIGEAAWTFPEHWLISAGYRAMNINYENDSKQRTWNVNFHGPVVGATFSW